MVKDKASIVYPNKAVHLTRVDLGDKGVLRPSGKYTPKGVSFSPTVRTALEGLTYFYNVSGGDKAAGVDWKERKKWAEKKSEWNVYTPVRKRRAVIPSTIDDYGRTRERRVKGKILVRKMGTVKVEVKNNQWTYRWL